MRINIMIMCVTLLMLVVWTDKVSPKAGLVVLCAIFLVHLSGLSNEHFSSEETGSDYEAVANLASMINDGTLKVTNIETTGTITSIGDIKSSGDLIAEGKVYKNTNKNCIASENNEWIQLANKYQWDNQGTSWLSSYGDAEVNRDGDSGDYAKWYVRQA
jgi:hypothetical protein